MSISVSRESISKLMTELVDTFPIESEGRSSISDFGKLLFAEGQSAAKRSNSSDAANKAAGDSASAGSTRTTPPSDDDDNEHDENDDNDENENENDDDEDLEDDNDDDDGEQSASEDAKLAGAPAGGAPKRVFTEIKGVPRQKQPDVQCVVAENGAISLSQSSVRKILKSKDKAVPKRWTQEEDDRLREAVGRHGERNWKLIAEEVPGRNHTQCLQRWTKVLAPGLVKGHWRPDEDELLKELVAEGRKNWGQVATRIPGRTSKQCRERWYNHLDPSIVRGEYSAEEDRIILEAQSRLGNRWSAIAAMLPGRTEDAVKIRWKSLCRVRKGQGARRSAQGGPPGTDKGARLPTPKASGMMMGPPPPSHHHHHMLHHHHLHPQLHAGAGSFSGGPIVKSEELGAFPATMRASPSQHLSHMQYASAMSAQAPPQPHQQMSGYHVVTSSQPAMVYASDLATVYDPSTGQYRKQSLAALQGGYTLPVAGGDAYSIDRRGNFVALSTPTQGYRGGGGVATTVGYAPTSGTAYATDLDGNIYTTSTSGGASGGYVMASVYHPPQQLMNASYGYSGPPQPSPSVAGAFAQQLAPPQQQQQQQHSYHQQQESLVREQPSPLQQQQQQQQQNETAHAAPISASPSNARAAAKAGAGASGPFNPAAMFAQAQQAKQQQQQPPAASSSISSVAKPGAANPVAAFLQQQQQKSRTSANGAPAAAAAVRPPFNPAAAFAQRFQAGKPPMPMPLPAATSTATAGKSRGEPDDPDEDAENGDKNGGGGAEPSLKKVKPRLSIDAARASAARRMRTSGSGAAALAGRGSLDVFLNEIGDVGRLSDLKMDEFQTLDELWRVSDDMNRLSL